MSSAVPIIYCSFVNRRAFSLSPIMARNNRLACAMCTEHMERDCRLWSACHGRDFATPAILFHTQKSKSRNSFVQSNNNNKRIRNEVQWITFASRYTLPRITIIKLSTHSTRASAMQVAITARNRRKH